MRVYVERCKTREYGKRHVQGIHLKKPTADQLADAVLQADKDGFTCVYVYDSSKTLVQLSAMIFEGLGLMVGWSNFCQTSEAFLIDERCIDITNEVQL